MERSTTAGWPTASAASGSPTRCPRRRPDPPVTRLTWPVVDHLPVALCRIEGGGHGGPQYQSAGSWGLFPAISTPPGSCWPPGH